MTEDMAINVKEQGEALGKIEDHIVQVNNNVKGAEKEIDEADKMTRKNTKRLCFIALAILFVVGSIVGICLALFLPSDDTSK
jgi:t-SNARE complex subunit (syntaxin)